MRGKDIIQSKLAAPRAAPIVVRRERLHARLDGHRGRVVLISAPAGFGKTVLVLDWLRDAPGPVSWLSVDRSDNDPTRFFAHLAAAVEAFDVPGSERAAALIGGSGIGAGPLSPALVEALAEMGSDPVLVLDDVHELDGQPVLAGLASLVHAAGPGPRIVLLSRVDPPLALGKLRLSGELLELRERDLRFGEAETAELFDRLMPGALDAALVERLERRTEGWVAGLRLAAIALQEADDPAAVVESFAGSHRFVVDYLLEEAVDRLDLAMQQFLMDTSILDRFTEAACMAVTGDPAAGARLAEVESANLFLVPLGDDRQWYRYHHLFAELLRFRLGRHQPERADVLHGRASAWFETKGDFHTALEHASLMTSPDRLLELLDGYALELLARSELATLRRWVERVPDALDRPFPLLLGAIGWLRVLTERAPDLAPVLAATAVALDRVPEDYDLSRRRRATVQLDALRAFAARYAGRFEDALEISRRLLAEIEDGDAFIRGITTFNMARTHMGLAEMAPASTLLERAFDDNLRARNLYLVLAGLGQTAAVTVQREGVRRAAEGVAAAVAFADQRGLAGLPAYSTVLYQSGHVEYVADALDRAETAFMAAVDLGRRTDFAEGHANGLIGLFRVALARKQFQEAEALLTEAAALERARNTVLMDTTIDLERTRLAFTRALYQGGAAPPAAAPGNGDGRWTAIRESDLVLTLWQALRHQRWEEARDAATRILEESEPRGRGMATCVALVGRAILPDHAARWDDLERALTMAAERGYVRPLLDGGEPVRSLLQASQPRAMSPVARTHARLLLDRFDAAAPQRGPAPGGGLLEALTEREEEVLEHLFQGHSNKAIARSMFVSVETVKTHLKHVYGKLGVTGRNDAVARARELGLARPSTAPRS